MWFNFDNCELPIIIESRCSVIQASDFPLKTEVSPLQEVIPWFFTCQLMPWTTLSLTATLPLWFPLATEGPPLAALCTTFYNSICEYAGTLWLAFEWCFRTLKISFLSPNAFCIGLQHGLPLTLRLLPRNNMSSFYKLLKILLFGCSWTESTSE